MFYAGNRQLTQKASSQLVVFYILASNLNVRFLDKIKYIWPQVLNELEFQTSTSSGKGGQHVNKVETRVTVIFNIEASGAIDEHLKGVILGNLRHRVSSGKLILSDQSSRSQHTNKERVVCRLYELLVEASKVPKKRKPTRVPKSVKEKRLKAKKAQGEKKSNRNFRMD